MAGNANSGRRQEKPFADALRMEIIEAGDDRKALRRIAKVLIAKASSGDMQAMAMLADRLDGKALQQIESHNLTEIVFAEVPKTENEDEWKQSLHVAAAGASSLAHKQH